MGLTNSVIYTSERDSHLFEPSPWDRLIELLKEDRRDLIILIVYVTLNGVLMLAVPLAAQALVNTIAAGIFLQPLVVLSLILLGVLLIVGMIRILKLVLVETLQQRIFVRIALQLAHRLPRISVTALKNRYAPELANRFFETMTIQKTWSKILLDGPAAVLQILIGLLLLAFYSPILLVFSLVFILMILGIIFGLGRGGLTTSIQESYKKYHVANWLEELGRCNISFKMSGIPSYTMQKADALVNDYLQARRRHFRIIFRHSAGTYLLYAFTSAGILAIGGWLVIERQLTLGQLVAAEIVVVAILSALERLMRLIESFYDMMAGLDKVGKIMDLAQDRDQDISVLVPPVFKGGQTGQGPELEVRNLHFHFLEHQSVLSNLSFKLEPGQNASLVGSSGSGKTTLAYLLCGFVEQTHGIITLDGIDIRDLSLEHLWRLVSMAGDPSKVFEGSIEENITLGREWISHQDIRWALEITELDQDLVRFPTGKKTHLASEGRNLSLGQRQRLMIARAIVDHPRMLILDEAMAAIEDESRARILDRLMDPQHGWTILFITHDPNILLRTRQVFVLGNGKIVESGSPHTLLKTPDSALQKMFPYLHNIKRGGGL